MAVELVDFRSITKAQRAAAGEILRSALAHLPSAHQGAGEAEAEVDLRWNDGDWLGSATLDGERLVGWVGAIRTYSHGWELHPLVVAPDRQRQGIGTTMIATIEARARQEGVLTMFLGTDDEHGGTTAFGYDLWADLPRYTAAIEASTRGHALTFYRRHGYQVIGLLPDVNGPGRPDILMAKRLLHL
ncbi:aminoglycoside 6'-N-acetyltransferase I [Rhodospirillales bacterium URHD0017]|nr:aminoglycoside 6'-N-acetyltransferase I [Rhodospirillales bacterium URHD0017]